MITFGYKNKFSSILRALSAIAIGLVMLFGSDATVTAVKVIAAFLVLAGAVSAVYGWIRGKKDGSATLPYVNAVIDVVLGLVLFLAPKAVAGFIVVLVGVAVVLLGVLQLVVLAGARAFVGMGFMTFVLAGLAVLLGIVLIWSPFGNRVMSIFAGSALVVYGISELIGAWKINQAIDAYEESKVTITDLGTAKEAEFTEVDEQ
jgi:uncharacterized membrane protein HdeD (DUF308 family)